MLDCDALDCHVLPVLMYGCEAWTLNSDTTKRIEATELWFSRRIMRISFSQHMSNEEALGKAATEKKVINNIKVGQLEFLGHVMRKDGMENFFITGFIYDKRRRGRQRIAR